MRTAVTGGTGSIGRLVVEELVRRGDDVRMLSRSAPTTPVPGATHHAVDLRSGDGLRDALDGVDVVVDAANGRKAPAELLVEGTRRVGRAAADSGVSHHVVISIVGCDLVPMEYYVAKVAQERAVAEGPVPWSVLRATQFHTLLDGALAAAARAGIRPRVAVPLHLVDPQVAADRLADAAHADPAGRLPDLGGPRRQSAAELADVWARVTGRGRIPLRVPLPGRLGRALRAGALCAAEDGADGPDFGAWLRAREAGEGAVVAAGTSAGAGS